MSKMTRIYGRNIELAIKRKYSNIEGFLKDANMIERDVNRLFEGRLLLNYAKLKEISQLTETPISEFLEMDKDYTFVEPYGEFTNSENEHKILDLIDDYIDLVDILSIQN